MRSVLTARIQDKLVDYLAGDMSLREFQKWFIPATWNVDRGDRIADELTATIDHRLAEYTNGDWSERELRSLLLPLVARFSFDETVPERYAPIRAETVETEPQTVSA